MSEFKIGDRVIHWDYCSQGRVVKTLVGGHVSVLWDGDTEPVATSESQIWAVDRSPVRIPLEAL